jgi:DNA-binding LacI/PurR family transcriptional regulator
MTVISQPMTGIAEAAVEMLMRQISAGKPEKPEIILLKNTITERESVIVRENV